MCAVISRYARKKGTPEDQHVIEYAKSGPHDILIRISATNRGPEAAELDLLPTLRFRNTWSWGGPPAAHPRPHMHAVDLSATSEQTLAAIAASHPSLGSFALGCEALNGVAPTLLFTENETNHAGKRRARASGICWHFVAATA